MRIDRNISKRHQSIPSYPCPLDRGMMWLVMVTNFACRLFNLLVASKPAFIRTLIHSIRVLEYCFVLIWIFTLTYSNLHFILKWYFSIRANIENDVAIFHNFYSSTLDKDENFTPTAIRCHNQQASLKLDGNDSLREVLFWHYKHTVILSWGGACITQYLRTVYIASDETFAWSTDLEDEFSHSSPSSPASLSD